MSIRAGGESQYKVYFFISKNWTFSILIHYYSLIVSTLKAVV
jgi:hypothetical protein